LDEEEEAREEEGKRRSENGTMDEGALAHSKESVIWHRYVSV
jgi:hypothetical protein